MSVSDASSTTDPRFERAWALCDKNDKDAPAAERKSACDIVIAAGKTGGGEKRVVSMARGEYLFIAAFRERARAYNGLGEYELARRDVDHWFELVGSDPAPEFRAIVPYAYVVRARSYYQQGSYKQALSDIDRSDEANESFMATFVLNPNERRNVMTLALRGDIAMATGDYRLALKSYEEYSRAYPNEPGFAEKIARARKMVDQSS